MPWHFLRKVNCGGCDYIIHLSLSQTAELLFMKFGNIFATKEQHSQCPKMGIHLFVIRDMSDTADWMLIISEGPISKNDTDYMELFSLHLKAVNSEVSGQTQLISLELPWSVDLLMGATLLKPWHSDSHCWPIGSSLSQPVLNFEGTESSGVSF